MRVLTVRSRTDSGKGVSGEVMRMLSLGVMSSVWAALLTSETAESSFPSTRRENL